MTKLKIITTYVWCLWQRRTNKAMLVGSHYSLDRALDAVTIWKTQFLLAQLGAAKAFTRYGFEGGGYPSCSLNQCSTKGAKPISNSNTYKVLTYTWEPQH